MKKIMILAALTLIAQSSFATDLANFASVSCSGSSGQVYANYDSTSHTLAVVKNGQEKSYTITQATGDAQSELVLNGHSSSNGSVQANLASDGTLMIYQVATGEVDYLTCQ